MISLLKMARDIYEDIVGKEGVEDSETRISHVKMIKERLEELDAESVAFGRSIQGKQVRVDVAEEQKQIATKALRMYDEGMANAYRNVIAFLLDDLDVSYKENRDIFDWLFRHVAPQAEVVEDEKATLSPEREDGLTWMGEPVCGDCAYGLLRGEDGAKAPRCEDGCPVGMEGVE